MALAKGLDGRNNMRVFNLERKSNSNLITTEEYHEWTFIIQFHKEKENL